MFTQQVFLTQTDTTVGFISQDADKLNNIKQRPPHKHYIIAVNRLQTLQTFVRVPTKHKNKIRRSNKSTFIFPKGNSYRVVKHKKHLLLLNRLKWAYTTSANRSNEDYDERFVKDVADVVIEPLNANSKASEIYKINNKTYKRIR